MDTDRKVKTYGLIVGILLFIALIAGLSYAYYGASASNSDVVKGTAGCFSVDYKKGNNISGEVILFDENSIINNNSITVKDGMGLTYVNAGINKSCTLDGYLTINVNTTSLNSAFISGDSKGAFKYVVAEYSPSTYTNPSISTLKGKSFNIIKSGSITSTGDKKILVEQLEHSTTKGYLIIFYVDGNLANNDAAGSTYISVISATATQGTSNTLSSTITKLYKSNSTVTNNSITYNYDTTHNLMKDTAGNIRYYGASPNNYIYFNCSTYPSTNCEKWRIIGVFNGKVKLIRNSSIGNYSWDTSSSSINSGWGINEWTQADAMKLLNPGYDSETVGGSLYYNSKSGTCYSGQSNATTACDFTSTGIKNDTTRNLIENVTWNTGGYNNSSIYSDQMYNYERGTTVVSNPSDGITRTTSWNGKIALPYPSDYGYATDFNKCSQNLNNYKNDECKNNDWMYPIITNSGKNYSWLLSPVSSIVGRALNVTSSGYVNYYSGASDGNGTVPVLYLSNDISLVSGDGSSNNPYQINTDGDIPNTYQKVEYIGASGTQYIDTGVNSGYNDDAMIEYSGNFNMSNNGTWNGANAYLQHSFTSSKVGDGVSTLSITSDDTIIVSYNGSTHVETLKTISSGSSVTRSWDGNSQFGGNIMFFNMGSSNKPYATTSTKGTLKHAKVYIGNELVRNLYPCYRKSDNVIGMYDTVNDKFYTNSGTGTFTKGKNIN